MVSQLRGVFGGCKACYGVVVMQWSAMVKMRGFPWFPLAKTNQDLLKKCNPRSKNFKKSLKTETTG